MTNIYRNKPSAGLKYVWYILCAPLILGSCSIVAFSSSHLTNKNSAASREQELFIEKLLNSQTDQDIQMERWYSEQGIIGTSHISLCTSDESVGGRGLFYVNYDIAEEGDIIALIPSRYVIAPSNARDAYPVLAAAMEESEISWQAKLTTYICSCLEENDDSKENCSSDDRSIQWKNLVNSWSGGGPSAAISSSEYSLDELQELADSVGCSLDVVREAIDTRYDCFTLDWNTVKQFNTRGKLDFGDLYSIVVSRVASLGPEWHNQGGIIPLHDMSNHPPYHRDSNMDLLCIGDVRRMIGDDDFSILIKALFVEDDNDNDNIHLSDDDVLLVASRNIQPGEELWLKYKDGHDMMDDNEKSLLMLQYGFPFHT